MSKVVTNSDSGTFSNEVQASQRNLVILDGKDKLQIKWDQDAKVTPTGSLVFFTQYLQVSGLWDQFCAEGSPLVYKSNNAPKVRDVWGTLLLSILNGQTRYAHINGLRSDRVGTELLGMEKVVSEDCIRRAFLKGEEQQWDQWLIKQERTVYEPLLTEKYILDIDNTVKQLYGHQEGAEISYNPKKPGRPSHNYHTYFIGALRIVLGVEVLPGKQHSGSHSMPGLWKMIDSLPATCRPWLLRGDISYGTERVMIESEKRYQSYLFKLKQTKKVKTRIRALEKQGAQWSNTGDGWEVAQSHLQLSGWTLPRRCIILRRRSKQEQQEHPLAYPSEFTFMEELKSGSNYEYIVLVTNTDLPLSSYGQLYRDRADCENVFDEIKNQWGWCGYVTSDLKRCRIMARLIALIYNWWNIFTRLATPEKHMEAATSRPLLLQAVGRLVTTGRKRILRLTFTHSFSGQIQTILTLIGEFLNKLSRSAEQLSASQRWTVILSAAFVKWLKGKILSPVSDGNQILLPIY